jgi:hypothetical protein
LTGKANQIGGMEPNWDNNYRGPTDAKNDNVDYARKIIRIMRCPNRPTGDNYKF